MQTNVLTILYEENVKIFKIAVAALILLALATTSASAENYRIKKAQMAYYCDSRSEHKPDTRTMVCRLISTQPVEKFLDFEKLSPDLQRKFLAAQKVFDNRP